MTTSKHSESSSVSLFSQFLAESNAAGSKFEKKVAKSISKWLEENGLDS